MKFLEDIPKKCWNRWVVNKVYNVYGFFDGAEVNGKTIDKLFNELGIDTTFDTVKEEISKGIKSYKLGDLDYWTVHIGHGDNGARFDIHGRVAYSSELIQLIDGDGTVTVYFDVQEQGDGELWNFGFIAEVGVSRIKTFDTILVESKKSTIKGLKESHKYNDSISLYDNLYYCNPKEMPSDEFLADLLYFAEKYDKDYNKKIDELMDMNCGEWFDYVIEYSPKIK